MAVVAAGQDRPRCWCVNRIGSVYTELIYLELCTPSRTWFRGRLNHEIETAVGTKGRRMLSMLPYEDCRRFAQVPESREKVIRGPCVEVSIFMFFQKT